MDSWFHLTDDGSTAWKIIAIASIPLAIFLRGAFTYLNNYCLQWVGARALARLRNQLFAHINTLSLGFFHQTSTGEPDVPGQQRRRRPPEHDQRQPRHGGEGTGHHRQPVRLPPDAGRRPHPAGVPPLSPLHCPDRRLCAQAPQNRGRSIQSEMAELSRLLEETFAGNRIIKAYNLEGPVQKQFEESSARCVGHSMRVVRSLELPGAIIEFVGSLGVAAIFLYIVLKGGSAPMALSDLVKFVGSIFLLYAPVKALTRLYHSQVQSRAASERIFEILALRSTVAEPTRPVPLRAARSVIHFDRVSFGYDREKKSALHEFDLMVQPGQMVALVGPSGAGKTTVTNLLLRFYDPVGGTIRIGGTDIRDAALKDLRSQMAVVTQETVLFNDTIRYNIELGRPGATLEEIHEAARHAQALDFILDKPLGFDTMLGERGVNLSGGQRQRVAIARAILRDAPILILDEATNALDTESERAVQTALDELMRHRTAICIAHRLSTIQKADVIVVMEEGRIVEMGKHADLLQAGGMYQRLYSLQFHD